MSDQIRALIKGVKNQEIPALAKLLTAIDSLGAASLGVSELLKPAKPACRIGITGPPGAGKSTLVNQIIKKLREQDLRVGVLAVDPSSPFTQGAVLGDRIRYNEHFQDEKVFIRSLGTRGSLGGLSASAYLFLRAFDLFGFDMVLIETVGVGQTELEVMYVADYVSLVLVPESGDAVQAMKAGIIEIADQFIVNKADRPGADGFVRELEASLRLSTTEKKISIHKTNGVSGDGIEPVVAEYLSFYRRGDYAKARQSADRLKQEAKALLRLEWESQISKSIQNVKTPEDLQQCLIKLKPSS